MSSQADNSLFYKHQNGHSLFLLVFVDVVIVTESSSLEVEKFIIFYEFFLGSILFSWY